MRTKQIIVVVIVFAIMFYLFRQPVKGLIKHNADGGHTNTTAAESKPVAHADVVMVSTTAKSLIGPALSAQIIEAEGQLKNAATETDKLNLQKKLAKLWD